MKVYSGFHSRLRLSELAFKEIWSHWSEATPLPTEPQSVEDFSAQKKFTKLQNKFYYLVLVQAVNFVIIHNGYDWRYLMLLWLTVI